MTEETKDERKRRLANERQARWAKNNKPAGFKTRNVTAHIDDWPAIKALEKQLRADREKDAQSNESSSGC